MKTSLKSFWVLLIYMGANTMFAQDCDIPMCVIIDQGFANVGAETASALETQLQRVATHSNINVSWENARFALTAKMDQNDRFIVAGPPQKIANVYGVTLYVADVYNQKVFSSTYFEAKGVGESDTKASMNAVSNINGNQAAVSKFLADTKQKIVNYYDTQLSVILKEAEVKASMKNYEGAIAMLAVVPTCCKGYDQAMSVALKYYVQYRDTYCLAILNKAKALWASNPTIGGSKAATSLLASIDPDAKCYAEAMKLLSSVAKEVKTDVDYELKKKYEDSVAIEKLRVQSIRDIGMAYGNHQPNTIMWMRDATSSPTIINNIP